MPELLLELLSEEIPARMQARAAEDLKRLVCEGLTKAQLSFDRAEAFVTPRRLALVVDGLPERQPEVREELKGPRLSSSENAYRGFAGRAHVPDADITKLMNLTLGQKLNIPTTNAPGGINNVSFSAANSGGQVVLLAEYIVPGRDTQEILYKLITEVFLNFQWPKSMRWGGSSIRWVRPLHNILAVFNGTPIPFSLPLDGNNALEANARTCGHRFLAPAEFAVSNFADYRDRLRAAKVLLDPAERRALIAERAAALAAAEELRVREDAGLLDEVTGLVEWPVPMLGSIDPRFMDVPPEVLITAMRAHQKYFSLLDADGKLAPRFVLVANTEATDGGAAIIAGNERVLRARLSDAKFFWDEDRKRTLERRVPRLAERVFHARLGSDLLRTERLETLARALAPFCNADPDLADRAAWLCKADLMSAMVGEFPELQGIMGRYYALHDGEPAEVAGAIADHYSPQGPSDRCPAAPVSVAVALADKIDTLAGFFAINEKPTGSRDPFALRRAALGVIRIIIENELRLPLLAVLDQAAGRAGNDAARTAGDASAMAMTNGHNAVSWVVLEFIADRLKVHLREQGVRHDLIAAVFAAGTEEGAEDDIVRLLARVDALRAFLDTDDGANLLVAYRRASNIVRIEENNDNKSYKGEVEEALFAETQEIELHRALSAARAGIGRALQGERFGEAMAILSALRAPVDAFFEHVKVNCTDADLRANRLNLLSQIRSALGGVADFSQIEG